MKTNGMLPLCSDMTVADPGFDLRGGVDFVNGGGGGGRKSLKVKVFQ